MSNFTGGGEETSNFTGGSPRVVFENPGYAVFCCCLGTLTAVSNGLVVVAYCLSKAVRQKINVFLISLTVCDALIGAVLIPFEMLHNYFRLLDFRSVGDVACAFVVGVPRAILTASFWTVFFVSMDRLIAVRYPLKHCRIVTPRRAYVALALMCSGGLLVELSPSFNREAHAVHSLCDGHYSYGLSYTIYTINAHLLAPLLLTLTCYAMAFRDIRRKRRSGAVLRAAQTCLIVSVVFSAGWLPFLLLVNTFSLCLAFKSAWPISMESHGMLASLLFDLGCVTSLVKPVCLWNRCRSLRLVWRGWLGKSARCGRPPAQRIEPSVFLIECESGETAC